MTEAVIEKEVELLVLVVDLTPCKRIAGDGGTALLQKTLDSVVTFANAHLMQTSLSKLAVIACNSGTTKFLYPSMEDNLEILGRPKYGQYELFSKVDSLVRRGLGEMMNVDVTQYSGTKSDSLLAGAMARALCHIHSVKKSLALNSQLSARVTVISGSSDSALQYMTFMNVFFTAQKENVVVDACMIGADSGLLQQGCDITGGQYLRVPNLHGLLEYLLWVFLPGPSSRCKIVLPPASKVDYRAACFCHRNLVDIGFVCSICLSIFCKFSPICTTCHAVFKSNTPLPLKPVKKKPRLE